MKYSTVIFDLDGTLLDTSEGIMVGASYTASKMGVSELTSEQQRSFIGPSPYHSFIRECGFTESKAREAVEIYRQRYKEKGLYEAKHYGFVKELLKALKDKEYKTGVATLKRDDLAKEILMNFELSIYIDSINGIDDMDTLSKSDIILMCLNELRQNDLSKVVLIGDSVHDAIGAEQVGIDFIAVTYGFGFKNKEEVSASKNVFIAESVEEIIKYLNL
ncbi:HAD hydrolase-like protein [Gottfriedia solisilvae]|uniref:Phosphoglycolate phosphatase n=1 Tax=Gottfriedia solisilvae TaxID=1516104 RepID=A0A8J3EZ58_9BACI|nr:HAD hydrolase-like protein [Gottfriedia solisilvae]GGI16640.1 phosphoglycolate phosphatase [Gottfriedia solisilvae]